MGKQFYSLKLINGLLKGLIMEIAVHHPQSTHLCHNDAVVSVSACPNMEALWTDPIATLLCHCGRIVLYNEIQNSMTVVTVNSPYDPAVDC